MGNGKIFYIIGKSASGKDKLYHMLTTDETLGLAEIVSYTTRPIREKETNGVEYNFVSEEELDALEKEGRVIEKRAYDTVQGIWYYATVDDGSVDVKSRPYISIGTLESYIKMRDYYGNDVVEPLYIDTEDSIRLGRAIKREKKQANPDYKEVCRRFLADSEDFSAEKIEEAGIKRVFENNEELDTVFNALKSHVGSVIIDVYGNNQI